MAISAVPNLTRSDAVARAQLLRVDSYDVVLDLTAFAEQPRFVYRHRWETDDVVMWDNRCTMHRAMPFDHRVHKRDLRTLRVTDSDAMLPAV